MPRILSNADIEGVLTMKATLAALDRAYRAWGQGLALSRPRSDTYLPADETTYYVLKSMDGIDGPARVGAIRLNSDVIGWETVLGKTRKVKRASAPGGRYNGLILLFGTDTGELLGIFADGFVQKMRVAATGGLSVRYLSRPESRVFGLIGSGWQASAAVEAVAAVRELDEIRVFSPNAEHRRAFAEALSPKVGVRITPVASAEAAVRGADIIATCTNSLHRVLQADWLEPGCHVFCVKYAELGDAVRERADVVVVNSKHPAPDNYLAGHTEPIDVHDPVEWLKMSAGKEAVADPHERWAESTPELWETILAPETGRRRPTDITCFVNNIGLGLQFAAVGKAALDLAQKQGLGVEVPIDWFVQTVHP